MPPVGIGLDGVELFGLQCARLISMEGMSRSEMGAGSKAEIRNEKRSKVEVAIVDLLDFFVGELIAVQNMVHDDAAFVALERGYKGVIGFDTSVDGRQKSAEGRYPSSLKVG